ncbi:MAG: outer membrane protein transport protein [Flavobacteriaceae bacterium]|nr:outer membrane protein transport protein [Flavobacteriaceae bacterium]
MKKTLLYLSLLATGLINAQEVRPEDGLRYSLQDINGTARFRAMSGAFGALGGDLSSLNVNPAGSVFFNNNYASISASVLNSKNKSNYFGTTTNENSSTLDLNQLGAVFIFTSDEKNWNKIALGFNYENMKDFDNDLFLSGTNPNNSISKYFVDYANLYANSSDFAYDQAQMGYDTYIIDPTSNPDVFVSNVPSGGNYYQANAISTTGFNGKMNANVAASYRNFLSIGLNLNLHITDYVRSSSLYESNSNPENTLPQSTIREIRFDNEVYTYGTGFSFNLGAIVKPTEFLRLGLSYESPTWYRLNDELTQDLYTTSINNPDGIQSPYYQSPIMIFPTYKLQTPAKATGSIAYIFKNIGLISFDISRKDYSSIEFKPKSDNTFRNINNFYTDNLKDNVLEIRLGGEYKYKQFSFRAGYRFEESPYKVDYEMGDLTGYSGGLGYNFGHNRLDLAYTNAHRNYNQYLISSGMNDTARIRTTQNNVTLTYSINF